MDGPDFLARLFDLAMRLDTFYLRSNCPSSNNHATNIELLLVANSKSRSLRSNVESQHTTYRIHMHSSYHVLVDPADSSRAS